MNVPVNIAETFVKTALTYPQKIAVIEAASGNTASFEELNKNSDCFANYLSENGVSSGDIVVLMVTPSANFISLTLALFKIGSPIVLIDPGMGYKNLLRCLEKIRPKYLIGVPKAVLFSRLFKKQFASIQQTFCCGNSLGLLGQDMLRIKKHAEPYSVYKPGPGDLAAIIFTTGSTGPPKGVRYEHAIFSAQLQKIQDYYKIGAGDIDQPGFPLFALFSAAMGACSVIPDMDPTRPAKVNPVKFVKSIKENQVTYSFGSPAIWNVVSNYCIKEKISLDSLQTVLMAGAPVPSELLRRMRRIVPESTNIHTPYGATESLPVISIESREILGNTAQKSLQGKGTCVGRTLPGIDLKIIKISDEIISHMEDAEELDSGLVGEIIVRGDVVTKGYMNNDPETRLAKIYDGETFWHRMGDTGYLDAVGRLWFCGRRAHRVVTPEATFFSIPCEAIVNVHKEVFRSALVGVLDYSNRRVPALIIEPVSKGINEKKLLKEVEELAATSTVTSAITHFLVHHDFPVDIRHNAKIFREKLAVWAQKKLYP